MRVEADKNCLPRACPKLGPTFFDTPFTLPSQLCPCWKGPASITEGSLLFPGKGRKYVTLPPCRSAIASRNRLWPKKSINHRAIRICACVHSIFFFQKSCLQSFIPQSPHTMYTYIWYPWVHVSFPYSIGKEVCLVLFGPVAHEEWVLGSTISRFEGASPCIMFYIKLRWLILGHKAFKKSLLIISCWIPQAFFCLRPGLYWKSEATMGM